MAAPSIPIPSNLPAFDSSTGELNKWVQVPTYNSPVEQSNGDIFLNLKFKGPYSSGISILSTIKTGDTLESAITALGTKVSQYSTPTCPTRNEKTGAWYVNEIKVDETNPVGAHCYLNIKAIATYGTDILTLTEDEGSETWVVQWQSYSVQPIEFAENKDYNDYALSGNTSDVDPKWSDKANAGAIDIAMQSSPKIISIGSNQNATKVITFKAKNTDTTLNRYLPVSNYYIYKKQNSGKKAIYHYPIIIRTRVYIGKSNTEFTTDIGNDIDTAAATIEDNPFTFEEQFDWIKTGDDVSKEINLAVDKVTYTRKETYWGVKKIDGKSGYDKNFYGTGQFTRDKNGFEEGRWSLGEI